ncbi:hypothetical protein B0H17DRAFT_21211 [Mycena rosella]|uniref:Uncharacterized protein n=1 Tax=Mycena rosella TaxID=1033263 RepID=A0AAD7GDE4_MYCRO|nr:hypothetical protein B0H17DRAFT_21211 [Mycena rosella]
MSSPPQLHLSLPPNTTSFKRSFEQFGFDLESPSTVHRSHEPIDGASTSASGESSSTMSSDGDENRRKRARSASSLSDPEDRSSEASSSTLSSFDSESSSPNSRISHSNSSQAAARRHLLLDLGLGRGLGSSVALGLSMASAELQLGSGRAIPEPPPRIPTPDLLESEDIDMPDVEMDFSHPEEHEEERPSRVEHVRRSVDRFNAFDRHISVLRSSSPPVIPLPASLNSRQASLSPPTLPPLPLVDLGLDAEDDDEDDGDQDHIPSTNPTITTTTSTPPRLDLNLPPTTSLSSGPSSPIAPPEPTSSTQFRERLDSAIDGLGGGDLYLEAPILTPLEQRADDGVTLDRYFEPARDSGDAAEATASGSSSNTVRRTRPLVETPLFEWPPALDWNITLGARPSSSTEVAQPLRSPPFSSWRPHVRPANATAAMDTTSADIRRFIGSSYSPPPHPPPPTRLYPRPASLAAPLSVPASTSSEAAALDADLVDAYLDFHRSNSNTRAWESALDRARALHREREREREQERERERERIRVAERERERERQREREEETEREMERPWSLDSIWEANARGESSSSSARSRPWMSLTLRPRRDVTEDTGRELDLELARRRALQRQITRNRETERERRGQPSVSSAARYLESGLVDPREAPRTAPNTSAPGREHRLRPPLDTTSNPFNVTWGPSRGTEMAEEDVPAFIHRSRGSSQSRDSSSIDWTTRTEHDEDHTHLDTFDDWFNFESEPPRSGPPRTVASSSTAHEREGFDYLRASGEGSSSGEFWRTRSTWQPRLAVSPQSTALPARTATHARAQSIPASSLSSLSSIAPQPSHARLRRLYGPSRAAGVGSSNSLVAENAAAIRRQEARTELMQRLNRTMTLDIDAHSDPESDWEPRTRQRARESRPDDAMDSEDDSLPQRVAQAIERIGSRPPLTSLRTLRVHRRSDPSPPRESPPLPLRLPSGSVRPRSVAFEDEAEEEPTASSSGLNSRRPFSTYTRRPVQRLRQHPISGEISPPPAASTTVDRRHVSWEAPSRDAGVSNTYQYLSALSHGFDSQSSSISDMAHTIASNSHTEEAHRSPASPMWGENESPFSTLFVRSPATPFSHRNPRYERGQMPGGYTDDTMDAVEDSSVPSLPPPDLGRNFERAEDVLRSATAEGARASSSTVATPTSDSPTTSYATRAPTPPSASSFTGPFRLTMQRREEYRRLRAANQRQIPDPPSIPPLYFGGDFENPSTSPSEDGSGSRVSVHYFPY